VVEFNYRVPTSTRQVSREELENLIPGIPSDADLVGMVNKVGKKGLLCKVLTLDPRDHQPGSLFYRNYRVVLRSSRIEVSHALTDKKIVVYKGPVQESKSLSIFPSGLFSKRVLR
jgi:hypothetical protein